MEIKFKDAWIFDLNTLNYTKIDWLKNISERSGHSLNTYDDKIILFGGLYKITQELNQVWKIDF